MIMILKICEKKHPTFRSCLRPLPQDMVAGDRQDGLGFIPGIMETGFYGSSTWLLTSGWLDILNLMLL